MKKIIITLFILIPLLSGCSSINANLSINNDSSAQFIVNMISDKNARPLEIATMNSNAENFLDESYEILDNSSSRKVNFTAKKDVENLKNEDIDLSSLGFVSQLPSGRFVDVKHNFFITSYNIDMVYNIKSIAQNVKYAKSVPEDFKSVLKPEYYQKYSDNNIDIDDPDPRADLIANFDNMLDKDNKAENSQNISKSKVDDYKLFDMSNLNAYFSISLPYFASYNNAQNVSGTVYSWDLKSNTPVEIKLQYVVYSSFSIALILILGISLLIYLAYRIYRHEALKRIGNNN